MYEEFYGLKEPPFSLTPDPSFFFQTPNVREALEGVVYGIDRREGFTVILGDVGTGKTMLCWSLLSMLKQSVRTALILNPLLTPEDMLRAIIQDFGVRPGRHREAQAEAAEGKEPPDPSWMHGLTRKELIDELSSFLLEAAIEDDVTNVLVIDEAQSLSLEVLEQLRILSNLETPKRKLLQIIFVGQLEFDHKLNLPQLRPLSQRITIRHELKPLGRDDMVRYIYHRLVVAGYKRGVKFSDGALRAIHRFSRGYPRLINVICDRALLAGYRERSRLITTRMVSKAASGLPKTERPAVRIRWIGPVRRALVVLLLAVLLLVIVAFILGGFHAIRSYL